MYSLILLDSLSFNCAPSYVSSMTNTTLRRNGWGLSETADDKEA